jgi:hypothetical protein
MKRLLFTILLLMGAAAMTTAQTVDIEFYLDMKEHTLKPGGVYIGGGSGFGGCTDNRMDSLGNGIYYKMFTVPDTFSSHYTFINGSGCWADKEQIGGLPCSDPANFNDRFVDVRGTTGVKVLTCFQECTTDTGMCTPVAGPVNVTFRCDMTGVTTDSLFLTGNFASWGDQAFKMDDSDGDDIYEVTTQLAAGIEFKFVNWTNGMASYETLDSIDGQPCVQNFGGFVNRVATIGNSDTTLCAFPYGRCCQSVPAAYDVEFSVDVSGMSPAPMAVNIGANWDGWSGSIPMADQGNGIWSTTLSLSPGPIEYKFITDGTWETLDSLLGQPCVMDFGGFVNRVDTVTDNAALCTPMIGQCCSATGINDLLVNNNLFVLRPTLASDFAYIDFPELRGETAQLKVLNAMGQVVLNKDVQTNGTHRLDVRSYAAGLYFVQVKVGNTIGTKKMIVD